MKNKKYYLEVSYDGSKFYGWGKQPNVRTVQGDIEKKLSKIFNHKVKTIASSRTDRYVHAKRQVFTIEKKIKNLNQKKEIKKLLNKIDGIKILKINLVDFGFSPRFDAKYKIYIYKTKLCKKKYNCLKKNDYFNIYKREIDIKLLQKYSKLFEGKKNFASFTGKTFYKNYEREINYVKIYKKKNFLYIEVKGKSFMRYMVRNIVGSLLALNSNKYTIEQFKELFEKPEKGKVVFKAPGSGLYLKKIFY